MHPSLNQHPVVRDFFWLTKFTSPFGTEDRRFGKLLNSLGAYKDEHGNYIIDIDVELSGTVFAAHLDTSDYKGMEKVRRKVKGNTIRSDGKTILGADNRAGIAVLLHLIRNRVPGRYAFFVGEEAGRVGSGDAARYDALHWQPFDRIICWDRFGKSSIITHQMGLRTCSNEFADALAEQYRQINPLLELWGDDGGSYTDSYSFIDVIPECTNISIGYYCQHTTSESQDAEFLVNMAEASVQMEWEKLPTVQTLFDRESKYSWYSKYPDFDSLWTKRDKFPGLHTTADRAATSYDEEDYTVPLAQDEILYSATSGVLTKKELEQFLFNEPDEAIQLFYDLLTGTQWGAWR